MKMFVIKNWPKLSEINDEEELPSMFIQLNEFECNVINFGYACNHRVAHMLIFAKLDIDWSQVGCEILQNLNKLACERNQIEIETHLKMWDTKGLHPTECSVDGFSGDIYIQILRSEIRNAEMYTLIKQKTELLVLFTCDEHLMSTLSRACYEKIWHLHAHYIRKIGNDDWVHFKDCWYWVKPYNLNLNDQTVEFTMNDQNYCHVLENNADILLQKRNFSYYFNPKKSLRCTEFCYLCEYIVYGSQPSACKGYKAMRRRDYINREIPNTLGHHLCECGHSAAMHYLDSEWDQHFAEISDYGGELKWPINHGCDRRIVQVQRTT